MRLRSVILLTTATIGGLVACGSDDDTSSAESASAATQPSTEGTETSGVDDVSDVVAGEAFPDDRCAANEAAGTITFLTGFDYAATASIVDVIVADANGYYDDVCLDVELVPSFSTANYPLIAENDAQFSSAGSFSEVVAFADANDAAFVVAAVEGPIAIDSLIVKPGEADSLEDLAGTTIGVKGKIPPSVAAMLGQVGLIEGEDYETVLLDGFDPTAHIVIESIVGFPGYKSNEPGALERAGIDFDLFDPVEYDIPGSFGVLYTNRDFVESHPNAYEDFMRATMRGLADAIADPDAAVAASVTLINEGGNPNFLSEEGESFRWTTDAALIDDLTPANTGYGVADVAALQNELDTYAQYGLFSGGESDADTTVPVATDYLDDVLATIYDDTGTVIWPG